MNNTDTGWQRFQQLLRKYRGKRKRAEMAKRTRHVQDGKELSERELRAIETELSTPPGAMTLRSVIEAYDIPRFEAFEALGMWPPPADESCSFANFTAFARGYRLQLTAADLVKGIVAVRGVST